MCGFICWAFLAKFNHDYVGSGNVENTGMVIDFGSGNGPYERLAILKGFEEALMAMAMEAEACLVIMGPSWITRFRSSSK